jgi:hypothetical protein
MLVFELLCGGTKFTIIALDGFDGILGNIFLEYRIDILRNGFKLRVKSRLANKSFSLEVDYQFSLLAVRINLVSMQEITFLVLMGVEEHGDGAKVERASPYPFCLSKVINKFSDVLTDDLPTSLPPNKNVDHKIEMHPRSTPLSKSPM